MPKSQNSGSYLIVEQENQYVNIAGISAGTVCIIGKGFLSNIVINTAAAGAITVYDSTSAAGTKIATIAASAPIGSNFQYNVELKNGLTIVAAAATDITVACKDNN